MCRMCGWNSFCRSIGFPMVMGFTHTVVYGVEYITSEELHHEMDKHYYDKDGQLRSMGEPVPSNRLIILDARRRDEYFMSHINHATNIHSTFFRGQKMKDDMLERLRGVDHDALIILYCAVGLRSSWLAKYLMGLGFTNVKVLYHGYYNWVNHGHPIYTRYPPEQILHRHQEHEFQRSHPPDVGIHRCTDKCYPTGRVLPQHWIASLVLESKYATKLPYPKFLYGDHIIPESLKDKTPQELEEKLDNNEGDTIAMDEHIKGKSEDNNFSLLFLFITLLRSLTKLFVDRDDKMMMARMMRSDDDIMMTYDDDIVMISDNNVMKLDKDRKVLENGMKVDAVVPEQMVGMPAN